ncbi:MAG: glycosyltransferase family 39 protein [Chloroflexi bacterium]|nr:glycosyltransferase family 39 protein [Chloroflexota bacterium]
MKRSTWVALVIILLIGVWLRVSDLTRIPPGLYHDEAFSGLDAWAIVRGAGLAIFFEGNGGREPLFVYLHALSLLLFGPTTFALRLPAAFVGILTLPVLFVLVRRLAPRKNSVGVALLATAALAVSYWHLNFSRVGWRTITLPLFACLAFYFFWRARRTGRLRDHLLAGLCLGAALYTYLSARFLPLVLVLFWGIEWLGMLLARPRHSTRLRAGILTAAVVVLGALIAFLPLALYFFIHPNAFLFRVGDVTLPTGESPVGAVLANLERVAAAFYANGDPEWRHGIARRALLDGVTAVPFALGLFVSLWRWRKLESLFALLWLVVMLLPTVLSRDAPDTQRAIGALPAVCLFIGVGFDAIAEFLSSRLALSRDAAGRARFAPSSGQWRVALLALVLAGAGGITFRDYFQTWADDKRAYYDFQGDLAGLARWMNAQPGNMLLPVALYAEPTIHFLTLSRFPEVRSILNLSDAERAQLGAEPGTAILPVFASDGAFVLLHDHSAILLAPNPRMDALLRGQAPQEEWKDRWGKLLGVSVKLPPGSTAAFTHSPAFSSTTADFNRQFDLVGYSLDDRHVTPGRPYALTLYWTSRAPTLALTDVFVHLLDAQGNVVAGSDAAPADGFPLSLFPQDQIVPDRRILSPDGTLSPGRYSLEIGAYQPANDSRLPVWIDHVRSADDRVLVSPLKVPVATSSALPAHPLDIQFGQATSGPDKDNSAIALAGFSLDPQKVQAGNPLELTLFWKGVQPVSRDYTVFVHLLDSSGRIVAQNDHQPQNGEYPTSLWDAGEQVQDVATLTVPTESPAGKYQIEVGLYDPNTLQRLSVVGNSDGAKGDHIVLEVPVEVESR